jgi:hypothetical protein
MGEGGDGSNTIGRHLCREWWPHGHEQCGYVLEAGGGVVGTDPSFEETVDRVVIQALAKGHGSGNAPTSHRVTTFCREVDGRAG